MGSVDFRIAIGFKALRVWYVGFDFEMGASSSESRDEFLPALRHRPLTSVCHSPGVGTSMHRRERPA